MKKSVLNEKEFGATPFIKLFRTPRCDYFFDVNRDMFCQVDEETYHLLEKLESGDITSWNATPITALKGCGWLSCHRPNAIRHSFTDRVDTWLENQVFQLILQVTQACNLCCIYCPYANNTDEKLFRSHSKKMMTWETAKAAIDFLASRSSASPEIFISFYGGEPLISFKLIQSCVAYANDIFEGKTIHYSITTNATLLTNEMLHFMHDNQFLITFSLDGPKEIHDRHRIRVDGSPTYAEVMEMLRKTIDLYDTASKERISINIVINPEDSLDELVEWLSDPLFDKIQVRSSLIENDYLEHKFLTNTTYQEKYSYMYALRLLDYLELVDGLSPNLVTEPVVNTLSQEYARLQSGALGLPDITSPSGPCVSGIRKLFVNTDGVFYPCEKVNELSECMKIGSITTGIDNQKVKEHLNIAQLTPNDCLNCWAQVHCTICQRQADGGDSLSAEYKNRFCNKVKRDFLDTLLACALMYERKTNYSLKD